MTFTRTEIEKQADRILKHPMFRGAKRISGLFSYIIAQNLKGKDQALNGITIAQDVFDKNEDFDPANDASVRVSVARLRKTLDEYYKTAGANDPLIISIPKGSYAAAFQSGRTASEIETGSRHLDKISPDRHQWLNWSVVLLLAAIILAPLYSGLGGLFREADDALVDDPVNLAGISRYPIVAVLPFDNLTNNPKYDNLQVGFQRQLSQDLYRFRVIKVVQIDDEDSPASQTANYQISGTIRSFEPEIDLVIRLTDTQTGQLIFEKQVRRGVDGPQYVDALVDISSEISGRLAGTQGAILESQMAKIKQRLGDEEFLLNQPSAFVCFSQYEDYASNITVAGHQATARCLREELERNPDDSTLLAAQGRFFTLLGYLNANPELKSRHPVFQHIEIDPDITEADGVKMAKKATKLDPGNDIALGYLADIQMGVGDISGAYMTLKQAMAANRGNPNHIANYAMILSYMGEWDEALNSANEAILRDPHPRFYYYMPHFYRAIIDQDGEQATIQLANIKDSFYNASGLYLSDILTFLTACVNKDRAVLNELRPKIQELLSKTPEEPFSIFKLYGGSEEIFDAFEREVKLAGIILEEPET